MKYLIFILSIFLGQSCTLTSRVHHPDLKEVHFYLHLEECINADALNTEVQLVITNQSAKDITVDYASFIIPIHVKDDKMNEIESYTPYELTYLSNNNNVRLVTIPSGKNKTLIYNTDFFRFYNLKHSENYLVQGAYFKNSKLDANSFIYTNEISFSICP